MLRQGPMLLDDLASSWWVALGFGKRVQVSKLSFVAHRSVVFLDQLTSQK